MGSFYPVFFCLIIVFCLMQTRSSQMQITKVRKRRKEKGKMDNSILMKYIGKECIITANGYISGVVGKVTEVSENWISVEDKKGKLTTFNCDYVSSIKEK